MASVACVTISYSYCKPRQETVRENSFVVNLAALKHIQCETLEQVIVTIIFPVWRIYFNKLNYLITYLKLACESSLVWLLEYFNQWISELLPDKWLENMTSYNKKKVYIY